MKLKRMGEDLAKFQFVECLTLEETLGILQNVGKDIKKETGRSVENCEIRDPDALMNLLIWMGKLYSRIYEANSSELNSAMRLEEYKSLEAKLRKELSVHETLESDLQKLKQQVSLLEERYAEKSKAKQKYDMLLERKQFLDIQLAKIEDAPMDIASFKEIVEKAEKTVLSLNQERNELESRLQTLQADKKSLDERNSKTLSNISALEVTIRQLQETLLGDAQKVEKLTSDKALLDGQNTAQKTKIVELEREVRNLKDFDVPDLIKKSADLELKKNRLANEKRQKNEEIRILEKEILDINIETDDVKQRKMEKEAEKLKLTENLNSAYGEISNINEVVKNLEEQINELELQLKGKSEESLIKTRKDRKAYLENKKEKCAMLEADILGIQNEIELQEKNAIEKEEKLKKIKIRAEEVEKELENYVSELVNLERRKAELDDRENRLDMFKQIHKALIQNASKLAYLPGIEDYTAEACVNELLKSADKILTDLQQTIETYVHAVNNNLEEIK